MRINCSMALAVLLGALVLSACALPGGAAATPEATITVTRGTLRTTIGGSGTISGQTLNGSDLVVNLTGVANAQMLSFNLTDVVDQLGNAVAAEQTQIGFLVGDVNGNGTVNSTDIGQVKAQAGSAIDANFRFDLNGNGAINATDVSIVKANAGATIP